jgi:hypothetical protein
VNQAGRHAPTLPPRPPSRQVISGARPRQARVRRVPVAGYRATRPRNGWDLVPVLRYAGNMRAAWLLLAVPR